MRKFAAFFAVLAALLTPLTASAEPQSAPQGKVRFGLGLATGFGPSPTPNAIIGRAEVTPALVVNGSLGFRLQNGDFNEGSRFGLGVSGQYRVFRTQSVNFHVLGGLSYAYGSSRDEDDIADPANPGKTLRRVTTISESDIALFAGFGAEYFFPNADNHFSMEVDVGPGIHILGQGTDVKVSNTTTSTDDTAFALSLGDAISTGVLFTYYF